MRTSSRGRRAASRPPAMPVASAAATMPGRSIGTGIPPSEPLRTPPESVDDSAAPARCGRIREMHKPDARGRAYAFLVNKQTIHNRCSCERGQAHNQLPRLRPRLKQTATRGAHAGVHIATRRTYGNAYCHAVRIWECNSPCGAHTGAYIAMRRAYGNAYRRAARIRECVSPCGAHTGMHIAMRRAYGNAYRRAARIRKCIPPRAGHT